MLFVKNNKFYYQIVFGVEFIFLRQNIVQRKPPAVRRLRLKGDCFYKAPNQYQSCFSPLSSALIFSISSSLSSNPNRSRFSFICSGLLDPGITTTPF